MGFGHHGRTYRLDWEDASIREWDCTVVWSDPADPEAGIVLDRSAFYPGGGGQPPDHGVLLWQGVQTRTGGNMEPGEARMDFNLPEVPAGFKQTLEDAVNAEIEADRQIAVRWMPRDE